MNSLVSVIIPTCGKNEYFISCLKALSIQTYRYLEVVLIDNSMGHAVSRKVKEIYPSIEVYLPPKNLFYCDGMNKGIELSRGEFILCLNDDVVLDADYIEEAIRGFTLDSSIGMVSGKILRMDRKTLDSTGLFLTVFRTAKERGYGKLDKGQFERKGLIFGVSGSVAFYRKKMLDDVRVGGDWFDLNFRMFYEDMDLAWRANKCGWKAYYIPTALAYHVRGGTARSNAGLGKGWARAYLTDELCSDLLKNRYLMIIKNETWWGLFLHIVPMVAYDLCVWIYMVTFRIGVIKIFFSNLRHFPVALKIRHSRNRLS